jgi:predicted TIM-barrel fold metal-dependent hydrolase
MIELPIRRLREDAVLPERAYAADAGLDLAACERHELAPGERAVVGTGLAVAIPFMHTRPKYFGQIMGELLFWLGEDKILFSSDYAIWTPRWLIERFISFDIPEDMQPEYGFGISEVAKAKVLGLNAARLYDLPVPAGVVGTEMAGASA